MDEPVFHSDTWTGSAEGPKPGWYWRIFPRAPTNEEIGAAPADAFAADVVASEPWTPTIEQQNEWSKPTPKMSRETRRWARFAAATLLSPLLLLGSWMLAHAVSPDALWTDHREWLIVSGLAMIGLAVREFRCGIPSDPAVRTWVLAMAMSAIFGLACWYPFAVLSAHSNAVRSRPARTFEVRKTSCARCSAYYIHQRADGDTLEGESIGSPLRYWPVCTEAQRLDGDHGFVWIRVIERSAPSDHEIAWPIRREDCFSRKPLANLRG